MQRMTWDPHWVRVGSLSVVLEGFMEEVAPGERALGSVGGGEQMAFPGRTRVGEHQAFRAGTQAGALSAEVGRSEPRVVGSPVILTPPRAQHPLCSWPLDPIHGPAEEGPSLPPFHR